MKGHLNSFFYYRRSTNPIWLHSVRWSPVRYAALHGRMPCQSQHEGEKWCVLC